MSRILSTMSLASAGVALIILFDLATGQAPSGLNTFLGGAPGPMPEFVPINMGPPMQPFLARNDYGPRADYKKLEKLEKESGKKDEGSSKQKEELDSKSGGYNREYEEDKDKAKSEPGMIGQFQNSMSDAWKSLTSLGRQTRSVGAISEKLIDSQIVSSGRPIEDYEFRQYKNQGYIFFKVPKHLVCSD